MTSKRANWLFLVIILVHFGVVAFLIFFGALLPDSIILNFLLSQGILIVPTIIFLLTFERRERQPVLQMPMPPAPGMPQMPMPPAPKPFEAAGFRLSRCSMY